MPSLNDRVVLLTGGATGIGRAIALDMAAAGATVAIGDANVEGGRRTAGEILSAGGRASFRSCDVADAEQVAALDRDDPTERSRLPHNSSARSA
jgi:NAD(P)-dependent dehydrogenase (short-subunit alcohol dehydrogenase family)